MFMIKNMRNLQLRHLICNTCFLTAVNCVLLLMDRNLVKYLIITQIIIVLLN